MAETFLLAFRQRDRYDPSRADARAWLYGICTNLIGRHRRAEIRQYRAFAWRMQPPPVLLSSHAHDREAAVPCPTRG